MKWVCSDERLECMPRPVRIYVLMCCSPKCSDQMARDVKINESNKIDAS